MENNEVVAILKEMKEMLLSSNIPMAMEAIKGSLPCSTQLTVNNTLVSVIVGMVAMLEATPSYESN